MSKQPVFTGKELIKILLKYGFTVSRIKGSHHFLKHADGRCTSILVHSNETIGKGLLSKILADCELSTSQITDAI